MNPRILDELGPEQSCFYSSLPLFGVCALYLLRKTTEVDSRNIYRARRIDNSKLIKIICSRMHTKSK